MNWIFFVFLLLLVPSFSYAQESQINYDTCENEMIHQNVFAPFYYHITHDPVSSHTFKQRHDDNPNVNPFSRTPQENIEQGYPTWIEFGTASNQTATYEFELDLEYANSTDVSRPVNMQLFSANGLMMERKIFLEDNINCIAFRVHAVPQPHEFTYEEILEIAKSEFVGHVKQIVDAFDKTTYEFKFLINIVIVVMLVYSLLIAFLVIDNKNRKKEMNTLKSEYDIRNSLLATSIMKSDANIQFQQLSTLSMQKSWESLSSSIVGSFGVLSQRMQESVDSSREEFVELVKQLRHEIEVYEPVVENPPPTFADIEKHDSEPVEPKLSPEFHGKEKHDDSIKTVFNFDLSQLKDIVKPVMNMVKKEKPQLSDVEKQKQLWSKMTNEELYKEYSEYVKKSTDDMTKTNKHGINFEYATMLLDIINHRQTDVMND